MDEALAGHARVGMGAQVDVRVAEERQDRVIERRRRHFDLASRDSVAVLGNHPVEELQLHFAQLRLVVFAESATFGDQPPDARVAVEIQRIDPGELVPYLQVAQVVAAESGGRRAAIGRRGQRPAAARQQLGVSRVDVDHPLALRVEEVFDDELGVVLVEIGGRLQAQLEGPIPGAIAGKGFELDEQRRHQIERHPDVGKLAQNRHHAVIVLQRVETHPRQDVLAGHEVFVVRLVHVPQDGDTGHNQLSSLKSELSTFKSQVSGSGKG
jgi:hypothetical protein